MDEKAVLAIVLREMQAYGQGWRLDWSSFDGRTLRGQLGSLADWAHHALEGTTKGREYTAGSDFLRKQEQ